MRKLLFLLINLILTISLCAQNQIKTTSVNLNLRTSPCISENIICVIPKGSIFLVDNSNQSLTTWFKILYEGKEGYVYSKYIKKFNENENYKKIEYKYNKSYSPKNYYKNSKGEKVQSPTYYRVPPTGATAECRDGTYSFSHSRRGTCSHHGGVKRWLR
jgi:uncharacterized protein YgiM (DUF1202 family)